MRGYYLGDCNPIKQHQQLSNYSQCLTDDYQYQNQWSRSIPNQINYFQERPHPQNQQNIQQTQIERKEQLVKIESKEQLVEIDSFEQTKKLLAKDKYSKKTFQDYSKVYKNNQVEESDLSISQSQIIPAYLTQNNESLGNGSILLRLEHAENVERVELRTLNLQSPCNVCQSSIEFKCFKDKKYKSQSLQGSAICRRCNKNGDNKFVIQNNYKQKYPDGKQIKIQHKIADFNIEGLNEFKILEMELKVYCKCLSSSYKSYNWPDCKIQKLNKERVLIARNQIQLHLMCRECQNEIYFTPSEMSFQQQ